ncbi:MAG TPA: hypothetical protein VN757_06405 [Steroidobacteraceae bacterium]|nr:hypothetical protein [Steroidobacteraceae bacterium]
MEVQSELHRLLQRQGEIRRAMRQPGGIRITVERELFAIHEQLKKYPAASQAIAPEFAANGRKQ